MPPNPFGDFWLIVAMSTPPLPCFVPTIDHDLPGGRGLSRQPGPDRSRRLRDETDEVLITTMSNGVGAFSAVAVDEDRAMGMGGRSIR